MDWNDQERERAPQAELLLNTPSRLLPLDTLRGLIMVLMALDHASHFVAQQHPPGEYWGGPFPEYQHALPFFIRVITHLAAPGFFLLIGMSLELFAASRQKEGWGRVRISLHLVLRGLLLIALQLLVVNRAWELSPGGWVPSLYVGVLFALGGSMILGSLLLWLQPEVLLGMTGVLVLAVELFFVNPGYFSQSFSVPARLLLIPGGTRELWANYPVLPWLGLTVFGLACGHWLLTDRRLAYDRAIKLAGLFLATFFALRFLNGFGNVRPWSGGNWIAFLNPVKYPPSLTFLLLTTGTNLLLLGLFSRAGEVVQKVFQPLVIFGRVPLFFYLLHLFLYAAMGWLLTPQGSSLPTMLLLWFLGLLLMYLPCLWYGRFKTSRPVGSLWRFF